MRMPQQKYLRDSGTESMQDKARWRYSCIVLVKEEQLEVRTEIPQRLWQAGQSTSALFLHCLSHNGTIGGPDRNRVQPCHGDCDSGCEARRPCGVLISRFA